MFKISTKIALAALISISTLSSADASYVWEKEEVVKPLRYDRSYTSSQSSKRFVQGERDEQVFDNVDRRSSEYSLSRDEIYGQPSNTGYRGTSIGYNDDASFWDKHKGKIVAGAVIATTVTTALIYTAMKYMSGTTQDEQEQDHVSYHPGVVYDPIVNFTADILARETENAVRLGLNLVSSSDNALAIYDPEANQSFMSGFVNVASSFFAPFSNMVFGNTN
jgi:hypothetical protein